jgi:hypothetical protein
MKARNRKDATSPRSQHWTLYNPEDVAERLNIPLKDVDIALEETGFNKAVRIREQLIRWKTKLIAEQKILKHEEEDLKAKLKIIKSSQYETERTLRSVRDILRMPREKGGNDG